MLGAAYGDGPLLPSYISIAFCLFASELGLLRLTYACGRAGRCVMKRHPTNQLPRDKVRQTRHNQPRSGWLRVRRSIVATW